MPSLAILFDKSGRPIASPVTMEATVSWAARDGMAQAFNAAGQRIAELHNARIDWIEAGGIRIIGMEPTNPGATAFRLQSWQYQP